MKTANLTPSETKDASPFASRETGLTLIDVLISIFLGLLLLGVLMQTYLGSQKNLKLESALMSMDDKIRTASAILVHDIHRAGMIGCAHLTDTFPLTSRNDTPLRADNRLTGNHNQFTVRYAEYPHNYLLQTTDVITTRIITSNDIVFARGDILLISDCRHAEMVRVGEVSRQKGKLEITLTTPLHETFNAFAEVSRFIIHTFYIDSQHRLMMEDIHHRHSAWLSGITAIHVQYTDADGEDKPHSAIRDWKAVKGVAVDIDVSVPPLSRHTHLYAGIWS